MAVGDGEPHAEVTETESNVGVFGIEFGEEPRPSTPRAKQLHGGLIIFRVLGTRRTAGVGHAIGTHALIVFEGE
jgi:hypothetical protein